jgi:hypothetical protein
MEHITYSLKREQTNSEEYYRDVRVFTDAVLAKAADSLFPIAKEFTDYLRSYNLEAIRTFEEYVLELLSFSVLWRIYAYNALSVHRAPFIMLACMSEWCKKHQRIKPAIDLTRGVLFTLFLLPQKNNHQHATPTLENIDHVCKWFEATGEFREQALRFVRWRSFWGNKEPEDLQRTFSVIREFTTWFDEQSGQALGKYTENVDNFLQSADKGYRWREDRISSTRTRLEYHLNMVGAELMNRAFRAEFDTVEEHVVLVPGCMRSRPAEECQAKRVKEGLICEDCTPQCRVNQLHKLGKRQDFDVYIIPHASDLSLWSPRADRPKCGVIASACVTTLVEGGWELKRYDVDAQCVLLDYSGCNKHWRQDGIPTELNLHELRRILGAN